MTTEERARLDRCLKCECFADLRGLHGEKPGWYCTALGDDYDRSKHVALSGEFLGGPVGGCPKGYWDAIDLTATEAHIAQVSRTRKTKAIERYTAIVDAILPPGVDEKEIEDSLGRLATSCFKGDVKTAAEIAAGVEEGVKKNRGIQPISGAAETGQT